jgi:hypothetical protein
MSRPGFEESAVKNPSKRLWDFKLAFKALLCVSGPEGFRCPLLHRSRILAARIAFKRPSIVAFWLKISPQSGLTKWPWQKQSSRSSNTPRIVVQELKFL